MHCPWHCFACVFLARYHSPDWWPKELSLYSAVGFALFGPNASDRLSSRVEQSVSIITPSCIFVFGLEHRSVDRIAHAKAFDVVFRV